MLAPPRYPLPFSEEHRYSDNGIDRLEIHLQPLVTDSDYHTAVDSTPSFWFVIVLPSTSGWQDRLNFRLDSPKTPLRGATTRESADHMKVESLALRSLVRSQVTGDKKLTKRKARR